MEKELGIIIEGTNGAVWSALQKSGLPGPVVILILEGIIYNIQLAETKQKLEVVRAQINKPESEIRCEQVTDADPGGAES